MRRLIIVLLFLLIGGVAYSGELRIVEGGIQVATYATDVMGTFIKSTSGNRMDINALGQAHVVMRSTLDTTNSTLVPLASAGTFIGSACELLDYAEISVAVFADAPSATDGLAIEFSSDGVSWLADGDNYSIASGAHKTFSFQPPRSYFRVKYTNGGTPQTVFDLETILHKTRAKPSSHRLSDMVVGQDDAELVKAGLTALDTDTGLFTNIRAVTGDTGYNLKVSLDQVEQTTNSVQVIDYAHGELHAGLHYNVRNTALLAKAGTKDILVVTPDTTRWAHMVIGLETNDAAVTGWLFESPTITASGTLDGTRNRNRNFADSQTTLIYENPTVTATGTLLAKYALGSGKNSGGQARDSEEYVLKQNTLYLFRVTEGNIAATNINWTFDWYEHTNK